MYTEHATAVSKGLVLLPMNLSFLALYAPRNLVTRGTSMIRRRVCFVSLLLIASFALSRKAAAQDNSPHITAKPVADNSQAVTDEDIQMLRKDIRAQRKQIIAANMNLSEGEAEKFWPVYEQYVSDLVKLNGTKYALIKEYLQTQGNLTDTQAQSAVDQWISVDQSVAELRKKYIPSFRKALSPKNT